MAKGKVTITLDKSKAEEARALLGASSTSETIDIALARLIRVERLRKDIAAYRRCPPTPEELELALSGDFPELDDTDWEALCEGKGE